MCVYNNGLFMVRSYNWISSTVSFNDSHIPCFSLLLALQQKVTIVEQQHSIELHVQLILVIVVSNDCCVVLHSFFKFDFLNNKCYFLILLSWRRFFHCVCVFFQNVWKQQTFYCCCGCCWIFWWWSWWLLTWIKFFSFLNFFFVAFFTLLIIQ